MSSDEKQGPAYELDHVAAFTPARFVVPLDFILQAAFHRWFYITAIV
ncbi:MAG: hypothetical protein FWD31_00860 [Planctomycetaceae bacterium]|nr:hypothetical protein [Planctomycetaceae bacterium]